MAYERGVISTCDWTDVEGFSLAFASAPNARIMVE